MNVVRQQVTADELPHMPDDGFRCELVRGELRRMTPAGSEHGRIAMNFGAELRNHACANNLCFVYATGTGFRLSSEPDTVRAPDVSFVSRERAEEVGEVEGYWSGPPDLAVEVISPSDTYTEVEEKVFDWLDAGTKAVIVVNPRKRSMTVYKSLDDITVLAGEGVLKLRNIVPGFELAVRKVYSS